MAVHTNNNTTYYINPAYLTFVENSGYGANLIQVSASSSCYIRVFIPGEIGYDADGNYRRWKITAYNNKFPDNDLFYIYVRLERDGTSALIVYSKQLYNTDGSLEDGSTGASDTYYYIRIGEASATNGTSIREISYDTGRLESDQVKNEGTDLNEMWELDKHSTPWLIRAKQWLQSFTVKGFITLIGGIIFKSGDTEKAITDIKRSTDTDMEASDETVPTTKYVSNILEELDSKFLRKDVDDTARGVVTFEKQIKSEDFIQGNLFGAGWSVYKDANGNTVVETDRMIVRKDMTVSELIVNQETFSRGSTIYVKAGCTITRVEEYEGYYRCYYDNESGSRYSGFKENDQARCQRYDKSYDEVVKYYWRLVVGTGEDYVDLSKTDFDGAGVPEEGDDIAQLGHRTDKTRQSAIVISPDAGGSVVIWAGIDSYSLSDKNMVGMGVNSETGRAYLYGYGDMFFGDRNLNGNYITYQIKEGDTEPTLFVNANIDMREGSTGLNNLSEFKAVKDDLDNIKDSMDDMLVDFETIQQQADREFTIWYFDPEPTLENEPAVNWTTPELISLHDQDLYFSDLLARAWRFVDGEWKEITDERTLAALKLAQDAYDAASEANAFASEVKSYVDNVLPVELEGLQKQIDGAIESFFYKHEPSISNEPAVNWTTEEQKEMHLNDTFTNLEDGRSWRWTKDGDAYGWTEITDTATVEALRKAGEAQDTADQKRRVFVDTPYTPYDIGDLWVQGETGDIMRCATSRASGSYVDSDWIKASKYTDDTALDKFIKEEYAAQVEAIQSQIDKRAETWYQAEDPSLQWNTAELKEMHIGDLWYDTNKDQSFMWNGTAWVIQGVPDEVFDKIDGKASIYTSQPSSYRKNDLWILSEKTVLDKEYEAGVIVVATATSSVFVASHWTKKDKYTDDSALQEFITGDYAQQISIINGQLDKRSETWYQAEDPSLQWNTAELKEMHIGDLWYDTNKNQSFMWNGAAWVTQGVPDEVFDKIDGKSSIYTSEPSTYNKNDLWILQSDYTLDEVYEAGTIVVALQTSSSFVASHWTKRDRYTDDTEADKANQRLEQWASDDTISPLEKTALRQQMFDVKAEYTEIITAAAKYGISVSSYTNAYSLAVASLEKYTASEPENIAIESDYQYIAGYYEARETMRKAIDAAIKQETDKAYTKALEADGKAQTLQEELDGVQVDMDIIKEQSDREYTIWYFDPEPTLENEPAVNWTTQELLDLHDQDLYFSDLLARAWRFVDGTWEEITDERTLAALRIAQEAMDAATEARNYINNVLPGELDSLRQQIDGAIESFFYKYDPALDNEPAVGWTTDKQKETHLNDTFTNLESGRSWRWTKNGNTYGWTEITDTAAAEALKQAGLAKDTADSKRRVFVDTPYTPYDAGDLWVQGEQGDIMRCSVSRASGSYVASDWVKASKYTDDTKANDALEKYSDLEYLKDSFGNNALIGGVVLSKLVGVMNEDDSVEAFLNGGDTAIDETHGKLILAGGIPENASSGSTALEDRAKEATTRIYEDGSVYFANGKSRMGEDGSGQFAGGNIRWTKEGFTYRKAPDYIEWIEAGENYSDGDTIDLLKGAYIDLRSGGRMLNLNMPSGITEKVSMYVRYSYRSRSDYRSILNGSFALRKKDSIESDASEKMSVLSIGTPFELEYDPTTATWYYTGDYTINEGVAYLKEPAEEDVSFNTVSAVTIDAQGYSVSGTEGLTRTITINGVSSSYTLEFTGGLLTSFSQEYTDGGN